uniref:C3H1-type domain-containing protein n=1 Tax=Chromera velia CCMP2878 TaxID=1169474 RepID=A0A0G4F4N0_9ALVE|eukprot:Cvel_2738.t1-p1 / transcript=Cvel_2738.t1 / gene=Cvel_2738 / organism=Chromera_velia_CCMP2878 / gene_product=Zinc finger protein 36, C3H1 type-like 2-A, putative / transcript_product=Zinc finger protein 36, C3H1 type-like 2-A, putative / location=Cvel_scaffold109:129800-135025(-) / protein_length=921 / sequence_SO=supercontig / SO=protein_coding / is_pseudo=false
MRPKGSGGAECLDQFFRTKLCPHVMAKKPCPRESKCFYAHSQAELRLMPDLFKTKLCKVFADSLTCENGENCIYAHGREELRSTSDYYKTSMCRHWASGKCTLGEDCRHAHGEEEIRMRKGRLTAAGAPMTAAERRAFNKERKGAVILGPGMASVWSVQAPPLKGPGAGASRQQQKKEKESPPSHEKDSENDTRNKNKEQTDGQTPQRPKHVDTHVQTGPRFPPFLPPQHQGFPGHPHSNHFPSPHVPPHAPHEFPYPHGPFDHAASFNDPSIPFNFDAYPGSFAPHPFAQPGPHPDMIPMHPPAFPHPPNGSMPFPPINPIHLGGGDGMQPPPMQADPSAPSCRGIGANRPPWAAAAAGSGTRFGPFSGTASTMAAESDEILEEGGHWQKNKKKGEERLTKSGSSSSMNSTKAGGPFPGTKNGARAGRGIGPFQFEGGPGMPDPRSGIGPWPRGPGMVPDGFGMDPNFGFDAPQPFPVPAPHMPPHMQGMIPEELCGIPPADPFHPFHMQAGMHPPSMAAQSFFPPNPPPGGPAECLGGGPNFFSPAAAGGYGYSPPAAAGVDFEYGPHRGCDFPHPNNPHPPYTPQTYKFGPDGTPWCPPQTQQKGVQQQQGSSRGTSRLGKGGVVLAPRSSPPDAKKDVKKEEGSAEKGAERDGECPASGVMKKGKEGKASYTPVQTFKWRETEKSKNKGKGEETEKAEKKENESKSNEQTAANTPASASSPPMSEKTTRTTTAAAVAAATEAAMGDVATAAAEERATAAASSSSPTGSTDGEEGRKEPPPTPPVELDRFPSLSASMAVKSSVQRETGGRSGDETAPESEKETDTSSRDITEEGQHAGASVSSVSAPASKAPTSRSVSGGGEEGCRVDSDEKLYNGDREEEVAEKGNGEMKPADKLHERLASVKLEELLEAQPDQYEE